MANLAYLEKRGRLRALGGVSDVRPVFNAPFQQPRSAKRENINGRNRSSKIYAKLEHFQPLSRAVQGGHFGGSTRPGRHDNYCDVNSWKQIIGDYRRRTWITKDLSYPCKPI
jgi:hypothetical protein